jgi:DNA modification methylase
MNEWFDRCHFGDCLETLRRMPDGIVNTCITSPPYFGLRDYGHAGQIGLEPTPEEFVAKLVEVFREVRRVLRDDGTAWVNMGDSYCSTDKWGGGGNIGKNTVAADGSVPSWQVRNRRPAMPGFKPKDLLGIPWRLAMALQQDGAVDWKAVEVLDRVMRELMTPFQEAGEDVPDHILNTYERLAREWREAKGDSWYLRQDIIWSKPNPMPESVTDRCTKAHEYLFLLSKSPVYYCDMGAIKEPVAPSTTQRLSQDGESQQGSFRVPGKTNGAMKAVGGQRSKRDSFKRDGSKRAEVIPGQSMGTHRPDREESAYPLDDRNKRSVWTVSTKPYKGAHFATFPTDLIEPCILAGAPAGGVVLDPFFGSGTTGQVAQALGRKYIGIELNADYKPLQDERLRQPSLDLMAA